MELMPVRSSTIQAIGYNPETRQMKIQLKEEEQVYLFHGVPQLVFAAFLASSSKGTFFELHIRNKYQS